VPLGGNRASPGRTYRNLVTVFFLCGLWHGASWTFVVWGLFHGLFLALERLGLAAAVKRLWPPLRHVYLLLVVMVGWVFFREESLRGASSLLAAMVGLGRAEPTPYSPAWYLTPELILALLSGIVGSLPVGRWVGLWREQRGNHASLEWGVVLGSVAVTGFILVASVVQIAARTYNPFIYFRF